MRRLFTAGLLALAFVVSTSPPAFAFPQDDDPVGVAQVDTHAGSVDVEPVGVSLGEPTVELVQAFAPGYVEPLGAVIERTARIDVPPPNVVDLQRHASGYSNCRNDESAARRVGNGSLGTVAGRSQWRLTSVTRLGSL